VRSLLVALLHISCSVPVKML